MIPKLMEGTLPRLERAMDLVGMRQRLTASNIANVDTPGFKPTHLDFAASLDGAQRALELVRDDQRHIAVGSDGVQLHRELASRRADGNGVDIDREMADLNETATMYSALSQVVARRLQALRGAIEDRRG